MTTPAVNRSERIPAPTLLYLYDASSGAWIPWSRGNQNFMFVAETRPASQSSRLGTDGWRNPTAWSHTYEVIHLSSSVTVVSTRRDTGVPFTTNTGPLVSVEAVPFMSKVSSPPSWMRDSAVARCYAKLKNEGFNAATNLYERKQTESLIVDTMKFIGGTVKAFRRAQPKNWLRVVRTQTLGKWRHYPDEWLKVCYGWNPAMSDVQDACQKLVPKNPPPDRLKVSGRVRQRQNTSVNTWVDDLHGSFNCACEDTFEVRVVCFFEMDNPLLASFSSLGLTNPLELVWEELPYSFVVDWFLPIGPWLSNLDAGLGWRFKSGTVTEWSVRESRGRGEFVGTPTLTGYLTNCEGSARGMRMNRSVLTSAPAVGIPRFKNPVSLLHLSEGLSLLAGAFRHT